MSRIPAHAERRVHLSVHGRGEAPSGIIRIVVLRTRRLVLRPFRPEDVAAIAAFATAREYRRFLGDHRAPDEFVANNLGVEGAWVIELEGAVVGSIFLGEELACLLDPAVHRTGIAMEAAHAVISDAFGRRGYDEIVARANAENAASLRALALLGFVAAEDDTYRLHRSEWSPPGEEVVGTDWP
jgi:RimJ/RimL family protein N-acetyltransferase